MGLDENPAGLQSLEHVRLPGTDLTLSRLGFGTSALMSRVDRGESGRLLQAALDAGITHFDTARSYGFGEAELAVGDVFARQRHRVTLTTKVGILPPAQSPWLSSSKAAARAVLAMVPSLRGHIRRRAAGLTQADCFDPPTMARSLETSLRLLRTEYVDLLLLHEPSPHVLSRTEPLAFLQRMQREGKARYFGIAATPEVVGFALEHAPEYMSVVQTANSVFSQTLQQLGIEQDHAIITHSALGTWVQRLTASLASDTALAARWSHELGTDVAAPGCLIRLALQYNLTNLRESIVLFTSTKTTHIRENATAVAAVASTEQIQRFAVLVGKWMRSEAER